MCLIRWLIHFLGDALLAAGMPLGARLVAIGVERGEQSLDSGVEHARPAQDEPRVVEHRLPLGVRLGLGVILRVNLRLSLSYRRRL